MGTQLNLDSYPSLLANYTVQWTCPEYLTTPTGIPQHEELLFTDDIYPLQRDGFTFTPVGKLLSITPSTSSIRGATNSITLTLSGIPDTEIGAVLYSNIKGNIVRIKRYLWDSETAQIQLPSVGSVQGRFFGYIESYSVDDDYDYYGRSQTVSLTLNLNSWVDYLSNNFNARQTNTDSMKENFPDDTSFDRVSALKDTEFNFGAPRNQSNTNGRTTRPIQSSGGIWV